MYSMFCVSAASPGLYRQGGVSGILDKTLTFTYHNKTFFQKSLVGKNDSKFDKASQRDWKVTGVFLQVMFDGFTESPQRLNTQIKQVWPSAWHDRWAGCLLNLHMEKMY